MGRFCVREREDCFLFFRCVKAVLSKSKFSLASLAITVTYHSEFSSSILFTHFSLPFHSPRTPNFMFVGEGKACCQPESASRQ